LQVAEYGVVLFLIITFIGTILILSIISFTSFSEDHKNSAILSSLGASNEEIQDIYLQESLINCVISFFVSTVLSILLSKLINLIINKFIDIHDLIKIPIMEFMGIKFLFPLIIFMIFIFITILSTLIPISFSKHKSIKGELQSL
jgi:ABC-type antimicrobial peptide transport system permease subunit